MTAVDTDPAREFAAIRVAPALADLRAVIFDMDGVLVDTVPLHSAAWADLFDTALTVASGGSDVAPFDPDADYRRYVDGRRREDGVRAVLTARGLRLPDGNPDDPPDRPTIWGLANRKNALFRGLLTFPWVAGR